MGIPDPITEGSHVRQLPSRKYREAAETFGKPAMATENRKNRRKMVRFRAPRGRVVVPNGIPRMGVRA